MPVSFKLTSDVQDVLNDQKRMEQGNVRLEERMKILAAQADKAGEATSESFQQAAKSMDESAKEVKKLQAQLERLQTAREQGVISEEEFSQRANETARKLSELNTRQVQLQERAKAAIKASTAELRDQKRAQEILKQVAQQAADVAVKGTDRHKQELQRLEREYKDGKITVKDYGREVAKVHKDASQAADEQGGFVDKLGSGLTSQISSLASVAAGYLSVDAAINVVNKSLEEQRELERETLSVFSEVSDTQAEVIKNLGSVSLEDADAFLGNLLNLQTETGFKSAQALNLAAASTLSATGGNQALTLEVVRQVAPLAANDPGQLPELTGAVADIASLIGDESAEGIKRAIGMVLGTQGQARITSLGAFKEAASALAAVDATSSSDQGEMSDSERRRAKVTELIEGGAAFAAIGGAIKDPGGAQTKTAVANLASQLEELLPERDVVNAAGEIVRKGTGLKTLGERVEAVQGNEKLQRQFFLGDSASGINPASFRGAVKPVIRAMLTDENSEAAQRFTEALGQIKPDTKNVDQLLTNLVLASPQLAVDSAEKQSAANTQSLALGGENMAVTAAARKITQESLAKSREAFGFVERTFEGVGDSFDAGDTAFDSVEDKISHGQQLLLKRIEDLIQYGTEFEALGEDRFTDDSNLASSIQRVKQGKKLFGREAEATAAATDREREIVAYLKQQIIALEALRQGTESREDRLAAAIERQNQLAEQQLTETQKQTINKGHAAQAASQLGHQRQH